MNHGTSRPIRVTSGNQLAALNKAFARLPRLVKGLILLGLTGAIAGLDLATPPYIVFTGIYLFPIFFAAWHCGSRLSALVTLIALSANLYVSSRNFPITTPLWEQALSYSSLSLVFVTFLALMLSLRKAFHVLSKESRTDVLTGLQNLRGFLAALETELERTKRSGRTFSVALIDLDNFKQVNDLQGHLKGDELLIAVGECLTQNLREIDVVARIGGDEFGLMMPGTSQDEAALALGRLQPILRALLKSYDPRAGASIGVGVVAPDHSLSIHELMTKVDRLMYSVKNSTKDGISIAQL